VDWRTGKSKSATKLSDLGLSDDLNGASEIAVRGGSLVLTLPEYPEFGGDYLGALAGVTVAKVSPDGKTLLWHTRVKGCDGCDQGTTTITSANLQHGVLTSTFGGAFDFDTGKSLFASTAYVTPVADGVLSLSGGTPPVKSITAPDGSTMSVVSEPGGWRLDGALPPLPLRITLGKGSERSTPAKVVAFDPTTVNAVWKAPVDLVVGAMPTNAGPLTYDGHHLLFLSQDQVIAVDADTGAAAWKRNLGTGIYGLQVASDGTLIAHGYATSSEQFATATTGLDPDTGAVLWTVAGTGALVPNPDRGQSLLVVNPQHNGGPYVARLDPADRPTGLPAVPAEAPACPSGMTAISWTQYADGAILLCRLDHTYAVVFPGHPDWVAAELNFSPGGHEVVFSNGTRVRVSLGGRVLTTETDGTVTALPVTAAWNDAVGQVKVVTPSDLRTCPAGSWPISLSTYQGGWLLVCGTAADAPTSMLVEAGSDVTEVGSVTYRNGSYCGSAQANTICGYRSPAVVSVTTPDGAVTQHSADSNYFDGHGAGGTGQGNGSYGVETPDDNAKDQVRYLTQILQKSMAGRTNLQSAVDQVRTCTDLDSAVSLFNDVLTNRQELLDAIDSAPVDAVPDGQGLAASLRHALRLSHDSDQIWLQWAQSEQANGCALGQDNPLYQQVRSMNGDVAVAKEQFLTAWNREIAPTYKVRTFTVSQI